MGALGRPLGLIHFFAGLNALIPRVIKLGVASTSTVSEPRTTATAATNFPGFRDDAACGADETDGRRRGCWCVYVLIGQNNTHGENSHCFVCERIYMHDLRLQAFTPSDHL